MLWQSHVDARSRDESQKEDPGQLFPPYGINPLLNNHNNNYNNNHKKSISVQRPLLKQQQQQQSEQCEGVGVGGPVLFMLGPPRKKGAL